MNRTELKDAIIAAIVEENGALKAEEITERIFGRKTRGLHVQVNKILHDKSWSETFIYIGNGIGWTLTDNKWDEIEKERLTSERHR